MKITKDINPNIFRGYDIRGVVDVDINEDISYTIGRAFASKIRRMGKNKCVIGHDNRLSSPSLSKALLQGLLESGLDVIDLGLTTTPMYYFACLYFKIDCGIMITASHNPKDENGFKFAFQNYLNAKGEEIQEFYQEVISCDFLSGSGKVENRTVKKEYFDTLFHQISFGNNKRKVIFDPGNGTTSILLKDLMEHLPLECYAINAESDGSFPNHHPDPSIESNLEQLKAKVLELKADCGIAFDGDGDRVGVIDEKGNFIPIDYYMIIIIRDLIEKVTNKTFLYDVKCSKSLEDEIKKLGGIPYCYRTGNSYTRAKVQELDLAFGGELSGHVYFRDKFIGFDSGIYAGIRLLEILSNTSKPLSSLLDGINRYYSSPEMKYHSPDDIKNTVIAKIRKYCEDKNYSINTIDGIRVTFSDGWALVRVSNTGPNITARYEATTKERLEEIKQEFETLIAKYNQ